MCALAATIAPRIGAAERFGPDWSRVANQPCHLFNPHAVTGETLTWSGACVNGKGSGPGRAVWKSSDGTDVHEGEYRNGKANGRGTRTFFDGSRYQGIFRDDYLNGRGTYVGSDGERYEGEFVDGLPHGQGVRTWPNGNAYEGQFVEDRMHGHGTYTWSDGRSWEGEFLNDKLHGRGVYTTAEGRRWQGRYVHGEPGQGTWVRPEGEAAQQAQRTPDRNSWGAYTEIGEYWDGHQGFSVVWNAPTRQAALDQAVRKCWNKYSSHDCEKYMYVFSLSLPEGHDHQRQVDIGRYREVSMFRSRCAAVVTIQFEDGGLDTDIERWFFHSQEEARAHIRSRGGWHTFGVYCNGE